MESGDFGAVGQLAQWLAEVALKTETVCATTHHHRTEDSLVQGLALNQIIATLKGVLSVKICIYYTQIALLWL